MRKVFEFCGSPEMLIALLYSDDVCQTIKDEVRASRKVTLFMFAEEEPYYTPDSDDIQITKIGENIRPKVDLGEPVQVGEFGCEPDLFGKPLTNFEWSLDQKTWHHSGKRMPDVLGNIYVRHFSSEPVQIVDDLRFCDIVDRDQLNVEFEGADEMMGQKDRGDPEITCA